MERLSIWLKYFIAERLHTNPLWKGLKIIYSDASVPGEGEHKVLDYIRGQRNCEGYDPNLSHCIYGADADLIMLGLSTHEPRFYIIREVFVPPNKRKWAFWGGIGHDLEEWESFKNISSTEKKPLSNPILFQYIKIHNLRDYLALELEINDGVHTDIDNKIDDFIFLCFFVGNDFLPHLPSFRIRNGAIDLILSVYKHFLPKMRGYLTKDWKLNMENIGYLLKQIAQIEEELGHDTQPTNVNSRYEQRSGYNNKNEDNVQQELPKIESEIKATKNKVDFANGNWRMSYYQSKFHIEKDDLADFLAKISKAYLEGINWVYNYYYTGCPSWEWFYPFHYAPLAIDLLGHIQLAYNFNKGRPYRPVEQLMSVLPKQSSHALPAWLRPLLSNPHSDIIDFYPIKFALDSNGFKFAWMGVNLLPFVKEERLLSAINSKEEEFSESDKRRNQIGYEQLLFNVEHIPNLFDIVEDCAKDDFVYNLQNKEGHRLEGIIKSYEKPFLLDADIGRPRKELRLDDIANNKVLCLKVDLPHCDYHKCHYLEGAKEFPKEIEMSDLMQGDRRTFLGEMSLRVLERKLGIQRDPTLTYQSSYNSGMFSSGYYNDTSVRGGYNNNPNSGVPVKRPPEAPAYQLGTQSYNEIKRVKTGNDSYDYNRQYQRYPGQIPNSYGYMPAYPSGPRYPPPNGYSPINRYPASNQSYPPNSIPMQDPNTIVQLRPPPITQFSNFDSQNVRKRDKKAEDIEKERPKSQNRFSWLQDDK